MRALNLNALSSLHVAEVCYSSRLPCRPVSKPHVSANITEKSYPGKLSRRRVVVSASESPSSGAVSFAEVEALPVREESGALRAAPAVPGVYAFYDKEGVLQYIGLSRKVSF